MSFHHVLRFGWVFVVFTLPAWAAPAVPGIRNFRQVDSHVYRGGQPSQEGFAYLAKIGVKTILDLRKPGERSDWERKVVTASGMKYVNVPMSGLTPPSEAQISQILALFENSPAAGAVFVHCKRGADRTGAVVAAYRIDHDHWQNARALEEARADGMSFFQWPRMSFIRNFQPPTTLAKRTTPPQEAKAPLAAAPATALPAPAVAR